MQCMWFEHVERIIMVKIYTHFKDRSSLANQSVLVSNWNFIFQGLFLFRYIRYWISKYSFLVMLIFDKSSRFNYIIRFRYQHRIENELKFCWLDRWKIKILCFMFFFYSIRLNCFKWIRTILLISSSTQLWKALSFIFDYTVSAS